MCEDSAWTPSAQVSAWSITDQRWSLGRHSHGAGWGNGRPLRCCRSLLLERPLPGRGHATTVAFISDVISRRGNRRQRRASACQSAQLDRPVATTEGMVSPSVIAVPIRASTELFQRNSARSSLRARRISQAGSHIY